WTVDVCAEVPEGYNIVGVYDENGDLVSQADCVQTFVAGQTKVIAFEVIETGSPEPTLSVNLKAAHGKKAVKELKLESKGVRKAQKEIGRAALEVQGNGKSKVTGKAIDNSDGEGLLCRFVLFGMFC
ncbi:MAG: hypothetical protein AAB895_02110, partial [Patescibacteria group bacterium]